MRAEDIVRDWQRPFYNLAYRILGNEADASDATQEIFIQIFRNLGQYDPAREFRPWAYRIATNAIYRHLRDRKLRQSKENEAAMQEDRLVDPSEPYADAKRREFERAFALQMDLLPVEDRSLLVLHYDQGLNQTELAVALDLPRTTVQSKLQKALERLKKNLAGAGLLAAVPDIELWMQSSAPLAVPGQLSASLAAMAVPAGAASVSAGITIGGVLMTKNLLLGAALIGVLSLGAGIWAGKNLGADGAAPDQSTDALASQEASRQRQEREQLAARISQLEDENRKLLASASTREALPKMAEVTPAEKTAAEPVATPASSTLAAKKALDWSRFAELLAKNVDPLLASFEAEMEGSEVEPSKEDQAILQEFDTEFSKLTKEAREISDFPILDTEIMKGLTGAFFEKTLALSDSQAAALQKAVEHGVADARLHLEGADTLPSQAFLSRAEVLDSIAAHMDSSLQDAQRNRWSRIWPAAQMMLSGNSSISDIGLDGKPESAVLGRWTKAFSLNPDQEQSVRALAPELVKEAQGILGKYGQSGSSPSNLSPVERAKMNREFLMAQIRIEKRFANLLTPEQKKSLANKMPTIFRFGPGGGMRTNTTQRGPAF